MFKRDEEEKGHPREWNTLGFMRGDKGGERDKVHLADLDTVQE